MSHLMRENFTYTCSNTEGAGASGAVEVRAVTASIDISVVALVVL
jgi:hypothetical protein